MSFILEVAWKSYEDRVIPKAAGPTQRGETKRAFYAGAAALFGGLTEILEPGTDPTEKDMKTMDSVVAELFMFNEDVKAGRA